MTIPSKLIREGAGSLLGKEMRVSKLSFAPVQPQACARCGLEAAPGARVSNLFGFHPKRLLSLDGQDRQSPIASVQRTRSTLASHSAVPRGTNVKQMNANRAIRIAAPRTQGL